MLSPCRCEIEPLNGCCFSLLHQRALPMSPAKPRDRHMYSGLKRCSSTHRGVACSMRSTTMRMGWPSLGLIYDWEAAQERRRHSALPRHCPWTPRVHRRRLCSVATKQKRLIGAHLICTSQVFAGIPTRKLSAFRNSGGCFDGQTDTPDLGGGNSEIFGMFTSKIGEDVRPI